MKTTIRQAKSLLQYWYINKNNNNQITSLNNFNKFTFYVRNRNSLFINIAYFSIVFSTKRRKVLDSNYLSRIKSFPDLIHTQTKTSQVIEDSGHGIWRWAVSNRWLFIPDQSKTPIMEILHVNSETFKSTLRQTILIDPFNLSILYWQWKST